MTDTNRRRLDTSNLGPIRIALTSPLAREARQLLADKVAAQGPGWRNAADSIRSGSYGNVWTTAALAAIEEALRKGPRDE